MPPLSDLDDSRMRILFCSQTHLTPELGASKVLIELAEEMELLGWECTLVSPYDVAPTLSNTHDYPEHLRQYLLQHAIDYDVVDYDHHHLPFPRSEFPNRTLFVARSVLLWRHFLKISLPLERNLKSRLRSLVNARTRGKKKEAGRRSASTTVSESDLINVLNYDDRAALIEIGIPQEKIAVIPNGLSRLNRQLFDAISSTSPRDPKVAFVGTFDNRKGATDFPQIVEAVCQAIPAASFRLLGTGRDEETVLGMFPRRLRNAIEVIPRYSPSELPGLLAPCSVGVFPSYIEGFGLGVLEMLAASIPVVAYNSPGPPMMLPSEYLVQPADWRALSCNVIDLLTNQNRLIRARIWAREQSKDFCWRSIAKQTSDIYIDHLRRLRMKSSSSLAYSQST
jgi:glycosyltransferase involved in cell wall biosynthesis